MLAASACAQLLPLRVQTCRLVIKIVTVLPNNYEQRRILGLKLA